AASVFPGDTLVTRMWKESDRRIVFECAVEGREGKAISNAAIELFDEIPTRPTRQAPAATSAAAPAAAPVSADIFNAVGQLVASSPELAQKVATVFQFRLSSPDSVWTLDLKQGKVSPGE